MAAFRVVDDAHLERLLGWDQNPDPELRALEADLACEDDVFARTQPMRGGVRRLVAGSLAVALTVDAEGRGCPERLLDAGEW